MMRKIAFQIKVLGCKLHEFEIEQEIALITVSTIADYGLLAVQASAVRAASKRCPQVQILAGTDITIKLSPQDWIRICDPDILTMERVVENEIQDNIH